MVVRRTGLTRSERSAMHSFWSRFVRHSLVVGISLAAFGVVLGKGFLMAHRVYAGGGYDAENERVLWQTPLVMAGFGIGLTAFLDLAIGAIRKPVPVPVPVEAGNPATPMG